MVLQDSDAAPLVPGVRRGREDPGREALLRVFVCRRYWSVNLKEVKRRGIAKGGTYIDGIRFTYEGGQIRSLLSLLSYFGKGEMRERSLGIKIPPTNLKPDFSDQARDFANTLADGVTGKS